MRPPHHQTIEALSLETNPHDPTHGLLMLHGYGADGFDLLSLGQLWQQDLPTLAVSALQAPEPCEQAADGRQWFSLRSCDDRNYAKVGHLAEKAAHYVHQAITAMGEQMGLRADQIFLMGFSQGSMTALATLYTLPPLAGVLSYSGGLLSSHPPKVEALTIPILLIHGDSDAVVPPSLYAATLEALTSDGFTDIDAHLIPGLGHHIDEKSFLAGRAFLSHHMAA